MEGEVFAATKLGVPALRSGLAARDDLVAVLAAEGAHRLTLVSAPAGSGKTTLVTQWAASAAERRPFAWLSLDPEDSDPVRFWDGILRALAHVWPGAGERAAAALRAPGTSLTRTVVPLVVNEVAEHADPVVLVLDDLHVVEDPEAVRALGVLVERAPANLHVAVTTRRDPPLPLPRLRARGQLLELRAEDLRFSDEEAGAMLRGLGLEIEAEQLEALQASTEGWAAGLQLAGLSLRHRPRGVTLEGDPLRGAHVADYLGEEVLDAQPPSVRAFLLRTSVLERLSGPLCDAVLESTGSARRLWELADSGLFVVPLDASGTWYRYHHLFRETLSRRLHHEEPDAAAALDLRASAWLAREGQLSDAIRHALAAGRGADLVAAHWRTFFNRGELATVSGWLAALPAETVERDPQLWLARAWIALDTGRMDAIPAMLRAAEAGGTEEHRAWAALLRAVHAFKRGDLTAAAAGVERARGLEGEPAAFWRAVAAVVAGATAYWRGRDAVRELADALRIARADGNRLAELYALGYLSLVSGEDGDAEAAGVHLAAAEDLAARDPGLLEHFVALTLHLARAAEAHRRGRAPAAEAAAGRAVELARRGAGLVEEAESLRALAVAREATGQRAGAARALAEARVLAAACPDPGRLAERLGSAPATAPPVAATAASAAVEGLSDRELDVLRLLATELSQREIGAELYVSMNTVKTHVKNIFFKLRVGSRGEAVGRARDLGLL